MTRNRPLVYALAKRFSSSRVAYEELVQIGCVGLMKALNHFDLSYQVKFSTYAVPIILGEIKRFFRDDGSMRISRSMKENYLQMLKVRDELQQKLQREVTYEEIAEACNLDLSDVILAFEANQVTETALSILVLGIIVISCIRLTLSSLTVLRGGI